MNKIIQIIFVLMLVALPFSFAASIDSETESQIRTMDTTPGAEMRILQLQKALETQIIVGERAVAKVESETSFSTDILVDLIAELESILDEAQELEASASAEVTISEFVELKQSAKVVTKEFREQVSAMLNAQARSEVRAEAKAEASASSQIAGLQSQIRESKDKANKERAIKIATRSGLSVDSIARIESSSYSNARVSLLSELRGANAQVQSNARAEVKQSHTRRASLKTAVEARLVGLTDRIDARITAISKADVRAQISALGIGIGSESSGSATVRSEDEQRESQTNEEARVEAESESSIVVDDAVKINSNTRVTGAFS